MLITRHAVICVPTPAMFEMKAAVETLLFYGTFIILQNSIYVLIILSA
jgi:hypothetical protein